MGHSNRDRDADLLLERWLRDTAPGASWRAGSEVDVNLRGGRELPRNCGRGDMERCWLCGTDPTPADVAVSRPILSAFCGWSAAALVAGEILIAWPRGVDAPVMLAATAWRVALLWLLVPMVHRRQHGRRARWLLFALQAALGFGLASGHVVARLALRGHVFGY